MFVNPNLRRLQLGFVGSIVGYWAFSVALAVYAYTAGGTTLVAIAAFARYVPAAVAAPFAAALADRYPRQRVMVASDLIRAALLGVVGVGAALSLPPALVLSLVALSSAVGTVFRPALAALLPGLARDPRELTAANVVSSTIESVGILVGPALGGLLLAATSSQVVFIATAATLLWSAALVARVRTDAADGRIADAEPARVGGLLAGFRFISRHSRVALLVALCGAVAFVNGALNVLVVVLALRVLSAGEAWIGYLTAAIGFGALLGTVATASLVGRRLTGALAGGLVLWGAPLILVGVVTERPVALIALALIGIGDMLVQVAALTLIQRSVPDELLARVFGVLEAVLVGMVAIGALVTPAIVAALGTRGALVTVGALLPVLTAASWRLLRSAELAAPAPARALELLRSLDIFRPLPVPVLELLASRMTPVHVADGADVFQQGDEGDRYYLIANGQVEVSVDGRAVRREGAGEGFGEIALLRNVARTATVTAQGDVDLFALEREDFLSTVTGHNVSSAAAEDTVAANLSRARPATVGPSVSDQMTADGPLGRAAEETTELLN